MNRLKGHDIKRIIRLFLLLFLPTLVLCLGFFHLSFHSEESQILALSYEEQATYLDSLESIVAHEYQELFENLAVVAGADETQAYLRTPETTQTDELEGLFLRIAEAKPQFDQLRLLDAQGMEVLRVNHEEAGPTAVPAHLLQDKSDRPYFIDSLALAAGTVYVSPLDLNMEFGQIEIPHTPVVRVATPLAGPGGETQGILVINYNAENLFSRFSHALVHDGGYSLHPHILNAAGYYLYHPDESQRFGFMVDGRAQARLDLEDPALWAAIQTQKTGSYRSGTEIFSFQTQAPGKSAPWKQSSASPWIFIAHKDLASLPLYADLVGFGIDRTGLIMIFILALAEMVLAGLFYFFKKDQSQLEIASKVALNSGNAFLVTDHKNRIIDVNDDFLAVTGYGRDAVLGATPVLFRSQLHPPAFYKKIWQSLQKKGEWAGALWNRKKDGTLIPQQLKIYTVRDRLTRRIITHIGIYRDLALSMSKPLAGETDLFLPGCPLTDFIPAGSQPLHLVSFSIENLSNLHLRKQQRHALAAEFSGRIQDLTEASDILIQLNEKRYILAMTSVSDKTDLIIFLELISANLAYPCLLDGEEVQLEVKIGVAGYPADASTTEDLIHKSRLALKSAIQTPYRTYAFYDPQLQERFEYRNQIQSALKTALQNQAFHMVYQPQIDLRTGAVTGAEALIRWQHPKLGPVSPAVFIPMAEETRQIIPLGYWITERVFQDLVAIQDQLPKDFRMSVNLSVLQFKDPQLIAHFIHTAQTHGVDLKQIEVEITETVMMADLDAIRPILEEFHALGVTVSIDDFGTGFSSLSYLQHLPLNRLKVDRAFIKDYPAADDGTMAKVIADLAQTLRLPLLMEGAETKEQIAFLKRIGYDAVQGYYYAKPMDRQALAAFVNQAKTAGQPT